MAKDSCSEILEKAYRAAETRLKKKLIRDADLAGKIAYVAHCNNRAGVRFILAATLAKIDKPAVDIRKPFIDSYPDSEKGDAYPGRHYYDEKYVFEFITRHKLPCNSTTAFLTPGFRTKNIVLDLRVCLQIDLRRIIWA